MATNFSYREVLAVAEVRSLVKLHADGCLPQDDAVVQFFMQALVIADCPKVIPHCASLFPRHLHPILREYLRALQAKNYFGEIVAMAPGYTPEQQAALQPRFKSVADALHAYLDEPVVPTDIPDVEVDQSWIRFHEQPRRKDVHCKHEGCSEEAMVLSIMCPRHHYQMLHGQLPRGLE